jgi:hypothetical protein
LTFSKKRAYITLSDEFASLSGTELSVACACLTKTIEEMTGFVQPLLDEGFKIQIKG